ncbi:MAG: hypothetical protein WKF43_00830 [Acidimicrobiales bacterium]
MCSRTAFRRLTLTGLLCVVALLAATCLSVEPSGAGPSAAADTLAPPSDEGTLIGSSAKGGSPALAALEAKMGRTTSAHRVFNPGFRSDVLADSQVVDDKAKGRTTVYSVKMPWAEVAAGERDAAVTQLAQSLKADGRRFFLTFHHEAEEDGDPAMFRDAFARFGRTVKAVGASNVSVTHILMEWTFNRKSGRNPADWMPPADSFDVLALDVYIDPQKVDRTFAQATAAGMAEAQRLGKQFAVAEWGVVAKAGDVNARARTVAEGLAHAKANNFAFVCWFHSSIGVNAPPEGWYLDALNDAATVAAYGQGM